VGVALAKDRLARVPVGPIAIALGMLLVGLVWPYLFGVIGHSVGVWLVLIGAIVLATGGILDLRRHATASPDV
jgi:UDP-N-acetylmuramyl pentapeptide phosphotransferase/UDP-N-acetylglucosamine-1-phosphate transferase